MGNSTAIENAPIFTGKEFKQKYPNIKYVVLSNDNYTDGNGSLIYKEGENESMVFNKNNKEPELNEIWFVDYMYMASYLYGCDELYTHIHDVTILDDSTICMYKDNIRDDIVFNEFNVSYKIDKCILSKPSRISNDQIHCKNMCKLSPYAIFYLNKISHNQFINAINMDPLIVTMIRSKYKITDSMYNAYINSTVTKTPLLVKYLYRNIPNEDLTPSICTNLTNACVDNFEHMPDIVKTFESSYIYYSHTRNLMFIPKKFRYSVRSKYDSEQLRLAAISAQNAEKYQEQLSDRWGRHKVHPF
jgi:hypothetical protein